jgi:hypothetical protein
VDYGVSVYGETIARITDTAATTIITNSEDRPSDPIVGLIPELHGRVVYPRPDPIELVSMRFDLSASDITAIDERNKFVHFLGYIDYQDVFGISRRTKRSFFWRITEERSRAGLRVAYWEETGGKEHNYET